MDISSRWQPTKRFSPSLAHRVGRLVSVRANGSSANGSRRKAARSSEEARRSATALLRRRRNPARSRCDDERSARSSQRYRECRRAHRERTMTCVRRFRREPLRGAGDPNRSNPQRVRATSTLASPEHSSLSRRTAFRALRIRASAAACAAQAEFRRLPHLSAGRVSAAFCASLLVIFAALHFHLFGVSTSQQAAERDPLHARQPGCLVRHHAFRSASSCFPLIWHKSFFDGMQWRATAALAHVWRLIGAAVGVLCRGASPMRS